MQNRFSDSHADLLIVINSLIAEGCPQLALQLAGHWKNHGLKVELLCLAAYPNELQPEFEALGIPVHTFELWRGLVRYPQLAWLSYWLCRRRKPTSLLSFPFGWHALLAMGAKAAGVKHICAHVGNLPPVWTGAAFHRFKLLVQLGRPFTSRLLCLSDYILNATIADFSLKPREARRVYNSCDLKRFAAIRRLKTWPYFSPPRIGMVARLEQHKDHFTLLRAIALLRDQGIEVQLILIGEGSQRSQIEDLINKLELQNWVQLLGSRRDIPQLLSQLDLFVFSAQPDEGFGIALAEAMAANLPIVATDVGSCYEVLDGGRCGLLVKSGSATALADGIRQAFADPHGAQLRSSAAKSHAFKQFSVRSMAEAYGEELRLT